MANLRPRAHGGLQGCQMKVVFSREFDFVASEKMLHKIIFTIYKPVVVDMFDNICITYKICF